MTSLYVCLYPCLSVPMSVCLYLCLSVCIYVCLSLYIIAYLSVNQVMLLFCQTKTDSTPVRLDLPNVCSTFCSFFGNFCGMMAFAGGSLKK